MPEDIDLDGNDFDDGELADALLLAMVPGVGPIIRRTLLGRFGSAAAVLDARGAELDAVPGVGPKLRQAILMARDEIDVAGELARCREQGVDLLMETDDRYPRMLKEIPDPPGVLYARGELLPQDGLAIGIVGSRHATRYGIAQAERLARGLASAGMTVVSGLARGVDAAAHRGALAADGRTLAVLGSGLGRIYPAEHVGLADEVAAAGAVLSESPLDQPPFRQAFPQRNRLISGLSLGVIVVEAAKKSGALITARHAMEQNREVFAVPGRIDNRMSQGCHQLLRDGAKLVESVDDVLEELGPLVEATPDAAGEPVARPAELKLNDVERAVLSAVGAEPVLVDVVVDASGCDVPRVLSTLNVLELRRLVRRVDGNRVMRV